MNEVVFWVELETAEPQAVGVLVEPLEKAERLFARVARDDEICRDTVARVARSSFGGQVPRVGGAIYIGVLVRLSLARDDHDRATDVVAHALEADGQIGVTLPVPGRKFAPSTLELGQNEVGGIGCPRDAIGHEKPHAADDDVD